MCGGGGQRVRGGDHGHPACCTVTFFSWTLTWSRPSWFLVDPNVRRGLCAPLQVSVSYRRIGQLRTGACAPVRSRQILLRVAIRRRSRLPHAGAARRHAVASCTDKRRILKLTMLLTPPPSSFSWTLASGADGARLCKRCFLLCARGVITPAQTLPSPSARGAYFLLVLPTLRTGGDHPCANAPQPPPHGGLLPTRTSYFAQGG